MRYGLPWSMAMHFFHNGLLATPLILSTLLPLELVHKIETSQAIDIEEIGQNEKSIMIFMVLFIIILFILVVVSFIKTIKEYLRHAKLLELNKTYEKKN